MNCAPIATSTTTVPRETDLQDGHVDRMPPYKVILLDDPVTTMDFVILLLIECFGKDPTAAARHMWEVHLAGASHVATLPLEQAELKQEQVHRAARAAGFPFRCVIESA